MSSNAPQVSATFTPLCGASWTPIPVGEARNIGHDPGWWSAVHGLWSRDPATSRSAHKMWEIVADVSCEAIHRLAVNSGTRRARASPRNRRQPHVDRRGSRSHTRCRHPREPSGWRRRRCEQDRFTAPGGRRPRAPGRVNSCPQDLTGVAGTAMSNLSPLCTGRVHAQPTSRSRQVAGRRLRPRMVSAGR